MALNPAREYNISGTTDKRTAKDNQNLGIQTSARHS